MTSLDTLAAGIKTVDSFLAEDVLEPDLDHASSNITARVKLVRDAIDEVEAALEPALEEAPDEEVRALVRRRVAGLYASASALLQVSGDPSSAAKLRARAAELAPEEEQRAEILAGDAEPRPFTRLEHARWLFARGRRKDADRVAKAVLGETKSRPLRAAAQAIRRAPRPIDAAPSLFTLNGFGVGLYGERDRRDDGWYIATHCICAIFIPIFPLTAYRVRRTGPRSYQFAAKEALSPFARAYQILVAAAVVLGIGYGGISSYLRSPEHRARVALDEAKATEARGDRERALEQYTAVVREHGELAEAGPAAEGVVRLAAASVREPCTAEAVDKVAKVADAFEGMPPRARSAAAKPLVSHLTTWADQIGDGDANRIHASLTVIELASKVAGASLGAVPAEPLDARRSQLRRTLAAKVVGTRTLQALALYARPPTDLASLTAARAIVESFGTAPSLWIEAEHDVSAWADAAQKEPSLGDAARSAREKLEAARTAHAAETELLASGDEKKLAAALARSPGDQEVAVALAQIQRLKGDAKAALATLGALGAPGRMTANAQQLFAMCHADAGDLPAADRVLGDLVAERLPAFQEAQREFAGVANRAEEQLIEDAKAGNVDPELERRMTAAAENDRPEVFRTWLSERLRTDPRIKSLQAEFLRHEAVVPASLALGRIKLQRAAEASGEERRVLLADAEKAFLAIQHEAEGDPSYHLGLGQVYHRLGRTDEGNAELARVLDRKDPELTLGVANVYRDLGLPVRAKQIAEQLYASASDERWKQAAASLLGHLVVEVGLDEEDAVVWLKRADTSSFGVKQLLLRFDGRRLRRQGKLADADRAFARLAEGYERDAGHDAAAANNAAIAYQERYGATGDPAHLKAAAKQLESAHRLAPQNALVAGNLASALLQLASVGVLDRWVKTRSLALDGAETEIALGILLAGPLQDEAVAALRKDPAYHRSLDVAAEEQVLAPQHAEGYEAQMRWLVWSGDAPALEAMATRLAAMPPFDATTIAESRRLRQDKGRDAQTKALFAQWAARTADRVSRLEHAGHAPTLAIAEAVRSSALSRLVEYDPSAENLDGMVASARRAAQAWPEVGLEGGISSSLALAGLLRAGADDVAVRTVLDRDLRTFGVTMLLQRVAGGPDAAAGLAALRKRPEIVEAAQVRKAHMPKRPTLFELVLARVAGDAELEETARAAFDDKLLGSELAIAATLAPGQEPERYELDFFRRHGN